MLTYRRAALLTGLCLALVPACSGPGSPEATAGWAGVRGLTAAVPDGYTVQSDEDHPDVVTLDGDTTAYLVVDPYGERAPEEIASTLCTLAEGQGRECTAERRDHVTLEDSWYVVHTDGTTTTHQHVGRSTQPAATVRFSYDAEAPVPELESFLDALGPA